MESHPAKYVLGRDDTTVRGWAFAKVLHPMLNNRSGRHVVLLEMRMGEDIARVMGP